MNVNFKNLLSLHEIEYFCYGFRSSRADPVKNKFYLNNLNISFSKKKFILISRAYLFNFEFGERSKLLPTSQLF